MGQAEKVDSQGERLRAQKWFFGFRPLDIVKKHTLPFRIDRPIVLGLDADTSDVVWDRVGLCKHFPDAWFGVKLTQRLRIRSDQPLLSYGNGIVCNHINADKTPASQRHIGHMKIVGPPRGYRKGRREGIASGR